METRSDDRQRHLDVLICRMLSRFLLLALIFASWSTSPLIAQGGDETAASRLLAQAEQIAARGDLAAAARELRLVRTQFPNTVSATQALLGEARLHLQLGDPVAAQRVARELVDGWGRSLAAAGGLVLLAELDLAAATDRQAIERIRTELARVPLLYGPEAATTLPARTRARVLAGQLSLRLGEIERATGLLLAAAEDEPPSEATPAAQLELARAYLAGGSWTSAAWWAQRVVAGEGAPSTREAARNLLLSIERLEIRTGRGLPAWRSSRRLASGGLEANRGLVVGASPGGALLVADDRVGARELGADGAVARSINTAEAVAATYGLDGSGWVVLATGLVEISGIRRISFLNPDDSSKTLDRIVDVAPDPWGGWFVLDGRRDRVIRADAAGRAVGGVPGLGNRPAALAADALGRLYVLDGKAATVTRLDAAGTSTVVVRGGWKDAIDLAVDAAGRIAVLDEDGPQVKLYGADGRTLSTVGPNLPGGAVLDKPTSLALDSAGRLVVADRKAATLFLVE